MSVLLLIAGFFAILVGLTVTAVVIKQVQRQRYVKSLTGRGWQFIDDPTLDEIAMLHKPPFGRQFQRTADELTRGQTADGNWFQAFDYRTTEFSNRVLTVRLPRTLLELHVVAGPARPGVTAAALAGFPFPVFCDDADYARRFLRPSVLQALADYGRQCPLDISVDGNHLVAVGVSTDPELIAHSAAKLAAVARAIEPQLFADAALPEPSRGITFHGHPDWVYIGRNDHLLHTIEVSRGGNNHRTAEVITSYHDGLPFVAFEHHWQTQTTSTSTDAHGHTHTTTHTHNHVEFLMEFTLAFHSPPLYVSYDSQPSIRQWLRGLPEINFESQDFNRLFDIRCASHKFAYDVIHPRQMEYLRHTQPPPFIWGDGRVRFRLPRHEQDHIAWICEFVTGFIGRVPTFVWQDLQTPPPVQVRAPQNP